MNFANIFNVFSKRDRVTEENNKPLTREFRNRVFLLWRRTFRRESAGWGSDRSSLWSDVYDRLLYSLGQSRLSPRQANTPDDDLDNFLGECSDEHFLDFIEFSFQSEAVRRHEVSVPDLLKAVNRFFREDNLPYSLTDFTFVGDGRRLELEGYPQIIRRDSEALHRTAIEPALMLLRGSAFGEANKEFLGALADYRNGDHGDCVTKCGSALESVMKILCHRKGLPSQNEAAKLLNTIIPRTNLPSFLKPPLIQVATIRNELSSSHGAGMQPRTVPRHVAQYTINVTASAVLLLVQELDQ